MMKSKRRKKYLGTSFQKKLLLLIFASAVVPALFVAVCLYYLIFNLLSWQIGIPEAIAYNVLPVAKRVSTIIFIALPIMFFVIWGLFGNLIGKTIFSK